MSRRKRQADPAVEAREEPAGAERGPPRRVSADLAVLTAVFALVTALAELAGAASLGVAMGIGQIAFVVALLALLLRG